MAAETQELKLLARISGDSAEFEKATRRARRSVEDLERRLSQGNNRMALGLKSLGATVAAAFSVSKIIEFSRRAQAAGGEANAAGAKIADAFDRASIATANFAGRLPYVVGLLEAGAEFAERVAKALDKGPSALIEDTRTLEEKVKLLNKFAAEAGSSTRFGIPASVLRRERGGFFSAGPGDRSTQTDLDVSRFAAQSRGIRSALPFESKSAGLLVGNTLRDAEDQARALAAIEERQAEASLDLLRETNAQAAAEEADALRQRFELWETGQMERARMEEDARQASLEGIAANNARVLELEAEKQEELREAEEKRREELLRTADAVATSFGAALARTLVYGESFSKAMVGFVRQMAAEMIVATVRWVAQQIVSSLLSVQVAAQEMAAKVASAAAVTYASSFASTVGFLGPGAAGYAAGMTALMETGAAAAYGQALATFSAIGAAAGGLDRVPDTGTYLLHEGEAVIQPRQNERLARMLDAWEAGALGGGPQALRVEVPLRVSGRELARAVVDGTREGGGSGRWRLALAGG